MDCWLWIFAAFMLGGFIATVTMAMLSIAKSRDNQ
jgi:hypothetical protein